MKKILGKTLAWCEVQLNKVKATQVFDEAIALHGAKEFKKSLPLMISAAELGHAQAMSILGTMFLLGQGTAENGKEAEKWLMKSVEAGFAEAESVLGMAYATGKAGVKVNHVMAKKLLNKAAESGDEQSKEMLRMMDKGIGIFAKKSSSSRLH